jgi:hypothetical protein
MHVLTKCTVQEAKSPVKKSRPYIYVKFLALLGAPHICDISRLRVKKTGTRQTVTGTRGKQLDNQQQQEYRVLRNGAGNTATQKKIHRYETHNS